MKIGRSSYISQGNHVEATPTTATPKRQSRPPSQRTSAKPSASDAGPPDQRVAEQQHLAQAGGAGRRVAALGARLDVELRVHPDGATLQQPADRPRRVDVRAVVEEVRVEGVDVLVVVPRASAATG